MTASMALAELEKNKLTQFDPRIVDTFRMIIEGRDGSRTELKMGA